MKISDRWKQLNRLYFDSSPLLPDVSYSDDCEGLRRFIRYDSHGIEPDSPDDYFRKLSSGKEWFNWTKTEMRKAFYHGMSIESGVELFRWYGLHAMWVGCEPDQRWQLRELLDWFPATLPDSYFAEGDEFPADEVEQCLRDRLTKRKSHVMRDLMESIRLRQMQIDGVE